MEKRLTQVKEAASPTSTGHGPVLFDHGVPPKWPWSLAKVMIHQWLQLSLHERIVCGGL